MLISVWLLRLGFSRLRHKSLFWALVFPWYHTFLKDKKNHTFIRSTLGRWFCIFTSINILAQKTQKYIINSLGLFYGKSYIKVSTDFFRNLSSESYRNSSTSSIENPFRNSYEDTFSSGMNVMYMWVYSEIITGMLPRIFPKI